MKPVLYGTIVVGLLDAIDAIVATYYAASRKISVSRRQPLRYGAMSSLFQQSAGIGIPSALFAACGENL